MCETEGCFKNIKIGVIGDIDEEERKRIFSLIAAAPDLLDACEQVLYFFNNYSMVPPPISVIKNAIKKAKGR